MTTKQYTNWIYQGVLFLATGLLYTAILMRSILLYRDTQVIGNVIELLLLFMAVFLIELTLIKKNNRWFQIYLGLQAILVSALIYSRIYDEYDYFSILFSILGMQAMRRISLKAGISWILGFLIVIGYAFFHYEGFVEGLTRLLLFGSVIVFLSSSSFAVSRAQEARAHNESLTMQLQDANLKLEQYSQTLEQLGIARERQRLARELHDSVTQTIFSMTLTTQSALLLEERDPSRVNAQLDRLNKLAQSAQTEMHTLISELRPEQVVGDGLAEALRQLINTRQLPEGLSVKLEVDGDHAFLPNEYQVLFRIAQEALNNVVKHAFATTAEIRLHMDEPYWIEIDDDGQGFDLQQPQGSGRVGLAGMRERAEEIGWIFTIRSAPGEGTHIQVEKKKQELEA
jgi:signal transduction histidine kinase